MMNKIKSIFLTILFTTSLLVIFISSTKAADYNISCDTNGCTSPGTAIFNQTSVAPGDSFTKSFEVINTTNENIDINLTLNKLSNTDDIFLDVVDVVVKNSKNDIRFTGTLKAFLNASTDLKNIGGNQTENFFITLTLQDVDNQFQGKKAEFNLNINLSAHPAGSGPSVGGPSTGGDTASPSPSPVGFVAGLFTGSAPVGGVLGESTPPNQVTDFIQGVTAGAKSFNWWWPLAAQLIISSIYSLIKRKQSKSLTLLMVFPIILSILSQYIHSRIGCPTNNSFCEAYWLLNLFILLGNFIIFLLA